MRYIPVACVAMLLALSVAACVEDRRPVTSNDDFRPQVGLTPQFFGQAGDGTVIPNSKPDSDALAFAGRCNGAGGSPVALGMSECALIATRGTPSRVVSGEDQAGRSHDAIWYIEGGRRTVYKFDNDKLTNIVR